MNAVDRDNGRLVVGGGQADAYRARREALLAAVMDLTAELDVLEEQPSPDRERLQRALTSVAGMLERHVKESEAADGLLAQVAHVAPALSARVGQLHGEHAQLTGQVTELLEVATDVPAADVLSAARDLAARLDAHRHRGTELLLDAYMLDIPAGD